MVGVSHHVGVLLRSIIVVRRVILLVEFSVGKGVGAVIRASLVNHVLLERGLDLNGWRLLDDVALHLFNWVDSRCRVQGNGTFEVRIGQVAAGRSMWQG